ncbi:DUF1127 domain-containing protein [Mesorhizobium qingshengii]|uniref:DUF1127 domain-containing protein n=1 Tax=Mesorhizobium qingshengii TaxID=1165689 RepID=UPI00115F9115
MNSAQSRLGASSKLARQLRVLFRASLNRLVVRRLLEMDDHELWDLGISRHDVRQALRLPLYVDPSQALSRLKERGPECLRSCPADYP